MTIASMEGCAFDSSERFASDLGKAFRKRLYPDRGKDALANIVSTTPPFGDDGCRYRDANLLLCCPFQDLSSTLPSALERDEAPPCRT